SGLGPPRRVTRRGTGKDYQSMPAPPPPLAQVRAGVYELVLDVARPSITEYAVEELLRRVCVELTELCGLAGCVAGLVDGATGSLRTLIRSPPEGQPPVTLAI